MFDIQYKANNLSVRWELCSTFWRCWFGKCHVFKYLLQNWFYI